MRHDPEGVGVEEGLWVYRGSWQADARYVFMSVHLQVDD
jgi:hypothetical protein